MLSSAKRLRLTGRKAEQVGRVRGASQCAMRDDTWGVIISGRTLVMRSSHQAALSGFGLVTRGSWLGCVAIGQVLIWLSAKRHASNQTLTDRGLGPVCKSSLSVRWFSATSSRHTRTAIRNAASICMRGFDMYHHSSSSHEQVTQPLSSLSLLLGGITQSGTGSSP